MGKRRIRVRSRQQKKQTKPVVFDGCLFFLLTVVLRTPYAYRTSYSCPILSSPRGGGGGAFEYLWTLLVVVFVFVFVFAESTTTTKVLSSTRSHGHGIRSSPHCIVCSAHQACCLLYSSNCLSLVSNQAVLVLVMPLGRWIVSRPSTEHQDSFMPCANKTSRGSQSSQASNFQLFSSSAPPALDSCNFHADHVPLPGNPNQSRSISQSSHVIDRAFQRTLRVRCFFQLTCHRSLLSQTGQHACPCRHCDGHLFSSL